MKHVLLISATISLLFAGVGAHANSLVSPGPQSKIAKSSLSTTAAGEWNKLSYSGGPNVEVWTRDGDNLNKVAFFGGVPVGMPLYRERDKKNSPLPKVVGNMLLPDIPVLLETTYRSQYQVSRISIDSQDIATVGGKESIRFTYTYVRSEDEVERKGEAVGTISGNKLYLVAYEAPAIYFFDKDLADFRKIVETLKF